MINNIKDQFRALTLEWQNQVTAELLRIDPGLELREEKWERTDFAGEPGGGGLTRAFSGNIIENAGVNTSLVYGKMAPDFAKRFGPDEQGTLWATGLSLIIHPRNPHIPTVHANFRLIEMGDRLWFGGGADLTPYYPHLEDFEHFHSIWKRACAPYGSYDQMKKQCDEYFVNAHRAGEMRGIGGIFFDHYDSGDLNQDLSMVKYMGDHFIESYFPIAHKRVATKWSEEDEDFQLHRRGRYVEFNLLHDRGTLFGLKSNGRTDSILISLPGRCKFSYDYAPKAGSIHEKMMPYYRPHEW